MVNHAEEIVKNGQPIIARVLNVLKDKFLVDLSLKPSDVNQPVEIKRREMDPYYDFSCVVRPSHLNSSTFYSNYS